MLLTQQNLMYRFSVILWHSQQTQSHQVNSLLSTRQFLLKSSRKQLFQMVLNSHYQQTTRVCFVVVRAFSFRQVQRKHTFLWRHLMVTSISKSTTMHTELTILPNTMRVGIYMISRKLHSQNPVN